MKVDLASIEGYKICRWFNGTKNTMVYGIDVIIGADTYHVKGGKKALLFDDIKDAVRELKRLNKELKEEKLKQKT